MKSWKYTKELLEPVVRESFSWAEVCRKIGIPPNTGSQTHFTRKAKQYDLDTSHFTGMCWNKGKELPRKYPLEDYLNNSRYIHSHKLKLRLIKEGLKEYKCEICLNTEWRGHPIPLELDHRDSNHFNNNLDNLQVVCPTCHALDTRLRKLDIDDNSAI